MLTPTNNRPIQHNILHAQTKQKLTIPKKKIIPSTAKRINQYDWKYLGAELRASSPSNGPWHKETSKKAREKTRP